MCPTSRFPASVTATIEGVVLYPPRFGMTTGLPFSTMATHEFVVPRSMPITFSIRGSPSVRSARSHRWGAHRQDARSLESTLLFDEAQIYREGVSGSSLDVSSTWRRAAKAPEYY